MNAPIHPLRHDERDPGTDPTGEGLLDRTVRPWAAWVPPFPAIVLGNSQSPELELDVANVQRDGIPVHKRISGGGAVLLSPECVCLGLRFRKRKSYSIQDYFSLGSGVIADVAREKLGLELLPRGISDLAVALPEGDRKVAGSSLYMPRDFALYLVSILIAPDPDRISRYLAHPSQEPGYRAGRSHTEFLGGLGPLSGRSLEAGEALGWFLEAIPGRLGDELDWERAAGA
jgi:lipoate-protein ligase A